MQAIPEKGRLPVKKAVYPCSWYGFAKNVISSSVGGSDYTSPKFHRNPFIICLLSERTPLEHCCVHNMAPFISTSGLSPGSREAKVCFNCTEPSVARSSYWSLPVIICAEQKNADVGTGQRDVVTGNSLCRWQLGGCVKRRRTSKEHSARLRSASLEQRPKSVLDIILIVTSSWYMVAILMT